MLIGKDTRISGYMLESALEAGFRPPASTSLLVRPDAHAGVAYLTRALRLSAGIVISASHNPFDDNGIKFFSADGMKLPDEVESEIERQIDEPIACVPPRPTSARPSASTTPRAATSSSARARSRPSSTCAAADRGRLRARRQLPRRARVFHELGADVVAIGSEPDGININDGVRRDRARPLLAEVVSARPTSASRSTATATAS